MFLPAETTVENEARASVGKGELFKLLDARLHPVLGLFACDCVEQQLPVSREGLQLRDADGVSVAPHLHFTKLYASQNIVRPVFTVRALQHSV
jgi:hypothetical protein